MGRTARRSSDKSRGGPPENLPVKHAIMRGAGDPTALGLDEVSSRLADAFVPLGALDSFDDPARQGRRIIRPKEVTRDTVANELAVPSDVGGDDEPPFRHGFERLQRRDRSEERRVGK